jgi:hypothetical protein
VWCPSEPGKSLASTVYRDGPSGVNIKAENVERVVESVVDVAGEEA